MPTDKPLPIGYVYFFLGRELLAHAPLYRGESSGGREVVDRVLLRDKRIGDEKYVAQLLLSKRVILPQRTLPAPVVYNKKSPANSDNSERKQRPKKAR